MVSEAFARVPGREGSSRLLLVLFLIGLALSVAATIVLRSGTGTANVGFVFVCTIETVPAPAFPQVMTTFAVEPVPLFLLAFAGLGYVLTYKRVRRGPSARLASMPRLVAFMTGLMLVVITVFGPLAAYSNTFLTAHMVQHFVLITIAPPLLLAGAPLTLLLVAIGRDRRNRRLYPILHARWFHAFTNPLVGLALFVLVPLGVYLTPVFEASLTNPWLHHLSYLVFLFAGVHYWWPVVGGNPSRWNLSYPVRAAYLVALVPIHAFLGSLFYEPSRVMFDGLQVIPREWGPSPLMDQKIAGAMMFVVGEAIGIISLLIVMYRWSRADEREARRGDVRRARQRALLDAARDVPD